MFLVSTSLKGVASMKLHRDLGVTQKTAWFLSMRIRTALSQGGTLFAGPVEVDETYVGGKRGNMSNASAQGPVQHWQRIGRKDCGSRAQRIGQPTRSLPRSCSPPTRIRCKDS